MASKVLKPEGRALTFRAKAAWSVAWTDAAKHFGGVGRDGTVTRSCEAAGETITRRLTSISKAHQAAGCNDSPASSRHFVVSETLKGIRRAIGTKQHGKDPLLTADIRRIVESCPEG